MAQPYLPAVLTSSLVATTTTGIPPQLAEQWCVSCSAVVAPGSSKVRLRPRKLTCHERARRRAAVTAAQQQQVATGTTPPTTPGTPVTNVLAVSCLLCGRTMRTAAYDDLRLAAHQVTGTRHGLLVLLLLLCCVPSLTKSGARQSTSLFDRLPPRPVSLLLLLRNKNKSQRRPTPQRERRPRHRLRSLLVHLAHLARRHFPCWLARPSSRRQPPPSRRHPRRNLPLSRHAYCSTDASRAHLRATLVLWASRCRTFCSRCDTGTHVPREVYIRTLAALVLLKYVVLVYYAYN